VAVVNETFVSTYLRGENPMGHRVKLAVLETLADPVREPWFEIVGVVADVTNNGLEASVQPEVWVPYTVTGSGEQLLLVRSEQEPMALMMTCVKRCGRPMPVSRWPFRARSRIASANRYMQALALAFS
jgi:hypothetical protein